MTDELPGTPLLVVAGEASGDLHGARLLAELRTLVPDLRPFGLGGDEMVATGFEPLADVSEISVVGLAEVARVWSRAKEMFDQLVEEAVRRRPKLAVLVDFPEFNLRLAKALHARGVPVVYYISPQVWAWRKGRVKTIARVVDTMLVLFPFEVDFYRRHGVEAIHVGHPLVDEVPADLPQAWDAGDGPDEGPYRVALLPGSRSSEVERLLPVMAAAVEHLSHRLGQGRAVVPVLIEAPTVRPELVDSLLADTELYALGVERVRGNRLETVSGCHFALCASGTATLEVGLVGTPLAVLYRLGTWTYWMAKLLVKLPHVSLVNLVLGRGVVPELIQKDARPEEIAREVLAVLDDADRRLEMRAGLAELRRRLGAGGASRRAAAEIAKRLEAAP